MQVLQHHSYFAIIIYTLSGRLLLFQNFAAKKMLIGCHRQTRTSTRMCTAHSPLITSLTTIHAYAFGDTQAEAISFNT